MSDPWIESRYRELINSKDANKIATGGIIEKAYNDKKLIKIVSGVSQNSMVMMEIIVK